MQFLRSAVLKMFIYSIPYSMALCICSYICLDVNITLLPTKEATFLRQCIPNRHIEFNVVKNNDKRANRLLS